MTLAAFASVLAVVILYIWVTSHLATFVFVVVFLTFTALVYQFGKERAQRGRSDY